MPAESFAALRGRIGAFATHARHDPKVTTANARRAFLARFEDEVDPHRVLSEPERERRAIAARRAHMAKLAYRSAVARSEKTAVDRDAIFEDSDR